MRRAALSVGIGLTIGIVGSLCAAQAVQYEFDNKGQQDVVKLNAYDPSTYATAYQVFTGSGDLKDAFVVAYAAVKQKPDDLQWREKLYQVSRWTARDDLAMEQLLYLIDRTNQSKFICLGIKLSEDLGDAEILQQLLKLKANHTPLTDQERIKLARSHEDLGDPEASIKYLNQQWQQTKNVSFLKQMADVYARMGALELEVKVLKLLGKYEVKSTSSVVREAQAYFAQNKLHQAFAVLSSVKNTARKSNVEYWSLYANIAWQLQKLDDALYAYKLIAQHKGLTDLSMRRYITLVGKTNVYKATQLSVQGWKQYKNPIYLVWFVQYSIKMNDWNAFDDIYRKFGTPAQLLLAQMPAYKMAKVQTLINKKNYAEARLTYLEAIAESPDNTDLKLAYLWFLMDRKHMPELQQRLVQWSNLKYKNDDFTLAFAVGYRLLGYKYQAIALMFEGLPKHMKDVVYLTNYLDQLMEMRSSDSEPSKPESDLRAYIWALIQVQAKEIKSWKDETFKVNYAKVAGRLAPGDATTAIMWYLSQFPKQEEATDVFMAWALANQYYAAAQYAYQRNQLAHSKTAPWIRLTLALHSYNKDKMYQLLRYDMEQLPPRDRVVAADRIGEETLSEELAYKGLKEYPDNQKTYRLFRDIMLPRSDYWGWDAEHVTTQLLMWQDYESDGRYFITPSLALEPYFSLHDQNGRNPTFITNVPRIDLQAGLRGHKILERGYLNGSIGMREAMETFTTSEWNWFDQLSDKWSMLWRLGIHQEANESDYMTAGAMQNRIGVMFFDNVTVRDEVSLEATQHYFYGQDGEAVSNGQVYRASFTHRMWLEYPDYFYRFYGSVNKFHNVPEVNGVLDTLVPLGQQAAASGQLLLPSSFVQYGFSLGVGERFREEYTHEWKPFAIASIFRNNTSRKLGTVFDGGIAGSVFGRDHLALFASHSAGVVGNANTRFVLGAAYRVYF
ncbi:MAG: tetratricopeptide repeat protein [Coxiellaceae bacterium]|nr:tetratricopeptide repeat protein [Coxiellaceae bacterium]